MICATSAMFRVTPYAATHGPRGTCAIAQRAPSSCSSGCTRGTSRPHPEGRPRYLLRPDASSDTSALPAGGYLHRRASSSPPAALPPPIAARSLPARVCLRARAEYRALPLPPCAPSASVARHARSTCHPLPEAAPCCQLAPLALLMLLLAAAAAQRRVATRPSYASRLLPRDMAPPPPGPSPPAATCRLHRDWRWHPRLPLARRVAATFAGRSPTRRCWHEFRHATRSCQRYVPLPMAILLCPPPRHGWQGARRHDRRPLSSAQLPAARLPAVML